MDEQQHMFVPVLLFSTLLSGLIGHYACPRALIEPPTFKAPATNTYTHIVYTSIVISEEVEPAASSAASASVGDAGVPHMIIFWFLLAWFVITALIFFIRFLASDVFAHLVDEYEVLLSDGSHITTSETFLYDGRPQDASTAPADATVQTDLAGMMQTCFASLDHTADNLNLLASLSLLPLQSATTIAPVTARADASTQTYLAEMVQSIFTPLPATTRDLPSVISAFSHYLQHEEISPPSTAGVDASTQTTTDETVQARSAPPAATANIVHFGSLVNAPLLQQQMAFAPSLLVAGASNEIMREKMPTSAPDTIAPAFRFDTSNLPDLKKLGAPPMQTVTAGIHNTFDGKKQGSCNAPLTAATKRIPAFKDLFNEVNKPEPTASVPGFQLHREKKSKPFPLPPTRQEREEFEDRNRNRKAMDSAPTAKQYSLHRPESSYTGEVAASEPKLKELSALPSVGAAPVFTPGAAAHPIKDTSEDVSKDDSHELYRLDQAGLDEPTVAPYASSTPGSSIETNESNQLSEAQDASNAVGMKTSEDLTEASMESHLAYGGEQMSLQQTPTPAGQKKNRSRTTKQRRESKKKQAAEEEARKLNERKAAEEEVQKLEDRKQS